jgi:hypothetical protein
MNDLERIKPVEQAYFELRRIRRELDALEDFLLSEIKKNNSEKPKSPGMIDPRNGELFKNK